VYRLDLRPDVTTVPECDPGHVYHLFPIRSRDRSALQAHLREAGVEAIAHYPISLPDQAAFAALAPEPCPVARQAASEVLSLPLYPRLAQEDVARVAALVNRFHGHSTSDRPGA
jgi:dTDP-4-amino-4,6-dideoxygalactose transaminase